MGPKPNDKCPSEGQMRRMPRHRERPCEDESRIRVLQPQVKDFQKPSEPGRSKGFSPRDFGKDVDPATLDSDFWLPNLWKNTFLIFLSHMVCYSSHRKRIHHPSKTRVPPSSNSSEWQLWSQNFEAVHDCSLHLTSKPSSLFNLIGFTLQLQSESSSSSQPPWP